MDPAAAAEKYEAWQQYYSQGSQQAQPQVRKGSVWF